MDQIHREFPQPGQKFLENLKNELLANLTTAVDSQVDPLVHEFLQLWGMGLRHGYLTVV